ncbi:hypothetical protein HY631_04560 [Candidatus Uhrbacteria bacterium]|nr:hypothetical protein [Candidatus Uhrbacteria bacterium]
MAIIQSNRPLLWLKLSFDGADASRQELDLYDVSVAMQGLHRTLAITTHAVLNGEIITQAPALKGASIRARPPTPGSWELVVAVLGLVGTGTAGVVGAAFALTTTGRDNPLGHVLFSAYHAVIKTTLGFDVDYEKPLLASYQEYKQKLRDAGLPDTAMPHVLRDAQIDSIAEKVEVAVLNVHRPIFETGTAERARLLAQVEGQQLLIGQELTAATAEYLQHTNRVDGIRVDDGVITSYNANTFKGRVYVPGKQRPIPFVIDEKARGSNEIAQVAASLQRFATDPKGPRVEVSFFGSELQSRSGRLKMYLIHEFLDLDDDGGEDEDDEETEYFDEDGDAFRGR